MFSAPTARLTSWVSEGWLRPVDAAFAALLATDAGESCETTLTMAALASNVVGAGHTCLDIPLLLSDPQCLLATGAPEQIPGWHTFIREWSAGSPNDLARLLLASRSVGNPGDEKPLILEEGRLYLWRYWCHEKHVAGALLKRMGDPRIPSQLPAALSILYPEVTHGNDWQKIAAALGAVMQFVIISGGPGTGKTTTVVKVLSLLQQLNLAEGLPPLRMALAAPTGKAAARLTASIGASIDSVPAGKLLPRRVQTLHRLLGYSSGHPPFKHHRYHPLHVDVLVIDEASMVDLEMMDAVLDALPAKARLILLGDKDQLASVEAGAVLGELCSRAHSGRYGSRVADCVDKAGAGRLEVSPDAVAFDDHVIMLRKSHRFSAESGIGRLAAAINAGDVATVRDVLGSSDKSIGRIAAADVVTSLETIILDNQRGWAEHLDAIRRVDAGQMASLDVDTWAASLLMLQGRLQILCAVRDGPQGVETINARLAELLFRQGLLPAAEGWYAGRPVMVTRNDHSLGLMNGDVGLTLPDPRHGGQLRVFFPVPGCVVRSVLPSRLVAVETVFAMTVHKAQGSEFAHTVLVMPERDSPVLTRELVYTAVTRAREKVTLVMPAPELLDIAIRRRVRRSSGLAARLGLTAGQAAPLAPAPTAIDVPKSHGVGARSPSGPAQLDLF
jgi:exodeoxyribonuclease V alpha subunit